MASAAHSHSGTPHSTIGPRSDIEQVPIERLKDFYKRWYQPDNAMLVVAGKFDEAKVFKWIADSFGKLPKPKSRPYPTYTVEPPQDGEREVSLRRVGDVQALGCVYHMCAGTHEDMAPLQVLADTLTADKTGLPAAGR